MQGTLDAASQLGRGKIKVAVQYAGQSRPFFLSRKWSFVELTEQIGKRFKIAAADIVVAYEFEGSRVAFDEAEWNYLQGEDDFPSKLFVTVPQTAASSKTLKHHASPPPPVPSVPSIPAAVKSSQEAQGAQDKDSDIVREIKLIPNWTCRLDYETHHFFVSYRVATDAQFAELLGNYLLRTERGKEPVHSFVDKACLVNGQPWEVGFLQGLLRAKVIVIMCSEGCLQKCTQADTVADNMLLEWELALDFFEKNKASIFLVLVGEASRPNGRLTLQAFNGFGLKFPDAFHAHPRSPRKRTVKKTMERLFALQGVHGWMPMAQDLVPKAHETLTRHVRKLPHVLTSDEMYQLQRFLSPVHQDKDRSDLREAYERGTRRWLVELAVAWAERDEERVLWVQGGPGVGKSVCAAIVADEFQKGLLLGGTFFCRHNDDVRKDPQSPDVLTKPIREQFDILILEPLKTLERPNKKVAFVVDALDECGTVENRSPILSVIAEEWRKLPSFVKLFVTSRQTPDIVQALKDLQPITTLNPDDSRNLTDLRLYAQSFLKKWDREGDINILVDELIVKSNGLFIWMNLARLQIERCTSLPAAKAIMFDLPGSLDVMYERNMAAAYESEPHFHNVLAGLIAAAEPVSVKGLAGLTGVDETVVMRICERLETMIVADQDVVKEKHKSVTEYLTDDRRCQPHFYINSRLTDRTLALRCLSILSTQLHKNILNLPPFTRLSAIRDLPDMIAKHIPEHLAYACKYWTRHLRLAEIGSGVIARFGGDLELTSAAERILKEKLLEWVECCAVLGRCDVVATSMAELGKWLDGALVESLDISVERYIQSLKTLTADLRRFIDKFHTPISISPLHTYTSALHFTPTQTQLYAMYHKTSSPLRISGSSKTWDACQRTFESHKASTTRMGVISIAVSRNARVMVTGCTDNSARVYDLESGTLLTTLVGHTDSVNSVGISDDGGKVITGSKDGTARIWDVETGRAECVLSHHSEAVNCVTMFGDLVATGGEDSTAAILNMRSTAIIANLHKHRGPITAISFVREAEVTITGCEDGEIRFWETKTGNLLEYILYGDKIVSLDVSANERIVVVGWADGTASVIDGHDTASVMDGHSECTLTILDGHSSFVTSVAITEDGHTIVTGSCDGTARIWDPATGETFTTLRGHTGGLEAVCFTATGNKVVTGAWDSSVKVWDATICDVEEEVVGHEAAIECVQCMKDGRLIATCSIDKTAKVWDTATQSLVRTFTGHTDHINCLAISASGKILITASHDKTARVWDVSTGSAIHILQDHTDGVWWVSLTPDGTRAVTGSFDYTAKTWDISTGALISSLDIGRWVDLAVISEDGRTVVTCAREERTGMGPYPPQQINIWNADTGEHVASLPIEIYEGRLKWLAIASDSPSIAVGYDVVDPVTVQLWELNDENVWEVVQENGDCREILSTGSYACSSWSGTGLRLVDGWIVDGEGRELLWMPSEYRGGETCTPKEGCFASFNAGKANSSFLLLWALHRRVSLPPATDVSISLLKFDERGTKQDTVKLAGLPPETNIKDLFAVPNGWEMQLAVKVHDVPRPADPAPASSSPLRVATEPESVPAQQQQQQQQHQQQGHREQHGQQQQQQLLSFWEWQREQPVCRFCACHKIACRLIFCGMTYHVAFLVAKDAEERLWVLSPTREAYFLSLRFWEEGGK
ncbi:hypothetical protein HK104_001513 [Borealophlyctis nickersoniae]|nr:hypothetical protein HK104_001513 [Borealophlyctis nickersoniae]